MNCQAAKRIQPTKPELLIRKTMSWKRKTNKNNWKRRTMTTMKIDWRRRLSTLWTIHRHLLYSLEESLTTTTSTSTVLRSQLPPRSHDDDNHHSSPTILSRWWQRQQHQPPSQAQATQIQKLVRRLLQQPACFICWLCHMTIHRSHDNWTLVLHNNTIDKLLSETR